MRKKVYILNGPNLNLLGKREQQLYGNQSFEDYLIELRTAFPDIEIEYRQTNHEGVLIDWLQEVGMKNDAIAKLTLALMKNGVTDAQLTYQLSTINYQLGIVLNAGGLTHYSVSLRDAIAAINTPVVEVHITNIMEREPFRRVSLLTDVCRATVMGKGLAGYKEAIEILIK